MKEKSFYLMITMLALMVAALGFTACSRDDEDDNSVSGLTSDEIEGLLIGKWEVHGEIRYKISPKRTLKKSYKGTIQFNWNEFRYNKIWEETDEEATEEAYYSRHLLRDYAYQCLNFGDNTPYTIARIGRKNYIVFTSVYKGKNSVNEDTKHTYNFEIVSITDKSFKFVLDTDDPYPYPGKLYMTMISD